MVPEEEEHTKKPGLCHPATARLTVLVCCAACEAMEAGFFGTFGGRCPLLPQLQCAISVSRAE